MWKGKDKATDEDFDDINPPISYRHILSTSLGVRDPLRVVALCDSDAFYASCEMVRLGVNQDEPLVVLQWDSLIAVNYPARTFGISRMNKLKDALKKCPHLRVVHVATYKEGEKEPGYWDSVDTKTHKVPHCPRGRACSRGSAERRFGQVSLDYYRRESTKIHAMFKESLPNAEVGEWYILKVRSHSFSWLIAAASERASIDEAFIDFTRPVRERILERFPHLSSVPSDAPHGLDTVVPPPVPIHWGDLGTLVSISPRSSPEDDPDGIADIDGQEDVPATWHDVALSIAAEMMRKVRYDVRTKLGYTTSAVRSNNP
jgi:DNA polymerase eta